MVCHFTLLISIQSITNLATKHNFNCDIKKMMRNGSHFKIFPATPTSRKICSGPIAKKLSNDLSQLCAKIHASITKGTIILPICHTNTGIDIEQKILYRQTNIT